jgi:predicted restriction endonuclease
MTERATLLIEEARKLTSDERREIADALIKSLDSSEALVEQAWLDEAKLRLAAYRRGEIAARDFDEVLVGYAG